MTDGLMHALCALSFFRNRHAGRPRYKQAARHRRDQRVSCFTECMASARHHIRLAREAGWRGSVREAVRAEGAT